MKKEKYAEVRRDEKRDFSRASSAENQPRPGEPKKAWQLYAKMANPDATFDEETGVSQPVATFPVTVPWQTSNIAKMGKMGRGRKLKSKEGKEKILKRWRNDMENHFRHCDSLWQLKTKQPNADWLEPDEAKSRTDTRSDVLKAFLETATGTYCDLHTGTV